MEVVGIQKGAGAWRIEVVGVQEVGEKMAGTLERGQEVGFPRKWKMG